MRPMVVAVTVSEQFKKIQLLNGLFWNKGHKSSCCVMVMP